MNDGRMILAKIAQKEKSNTPPRLLDGLQKTLLQKWAIILQRHTG